MKPGPDPRSHASTRGRPSVRRCSYYAHPAYMCDDPLVLRGTQADTGREGDEQGERGPRLMLADQDAVLPGHRQARYIVFA